MKHRKIENLFAYAMLMAFVSCNNLIGGSDYYLPFKSTEDGKWGLISDKGEVLFEEEFTHEPTIPTAGRFFVENADGLWEIYTATETPEKVGEEYKDILEFTADVTPAVKKNEPIVLIDRDGKVKKTLDKIGNKAIVQCSGFVYGYATVRTDEGKVGVINTKGESVIEPKYDDMWPVSSDKFAALTASKSQDGETKYLVTIIDKSGKEIKGLRFGDGQKYEVADFSSSDFEHGHIAVATKVDDNYKWGYINMDKEVLVKPNSKNHGFNGIKGDNFIFSDGDNYGVRNLKGETVLRAKYDLLEWVDDDLLVANDGKDGDYLINLKGEKITPDAYQDIWPVQFGENLPVQISDNSFGFITKEGKEVSTKEMPDIYMLKLNRQLGSVRSDYVDIDAIVRKLRIEKASLNGFSLSASPLQIAKAYNEILSSVPEQKVETGTPIDLNANENRGRDHFELVYEGAPGVYYRTYGYYSGYMARTDYMTNQASWSDDKPSYIESVVKISDGDDKSKKLFEKVASKVKTLGTVYKQNKGAVIVKVDNSSGYVAFRDGRRVCIRLVNSSDYQYVDITPYAVDNEKTEEFSDVVEATDFVEGVDSEAADAAEAAVEEAPAE